METKARYILVGLCTLIGIAVAFGFLMFTLNRGDKDKVVTFATEFTGSVAGLSQGNDVRFNGIRVGDVRSIKIDPNDPSRVRVIMAVNSDTPVRQDSEASLSVQGITGLAVVDISGGSASSPKLEPGRDEDIPIIRSRRSPLSSVVDQAPNLINQANELLTRSNNFLSPENQESISSILRSVAVLGQTLERQSGNLESAIENLAQVSQSLNQIVGRTESLLDGELNEGLANFKEAFSRLHQIFVQAEPGVQRLTGSAADDLQRVLNETQTLVRNMNLLINNLNSDPQRFFFGDNMPGLRIK